MEAEDNLTTLANKSSGFSSKAADNIRRLYPSVDDTVTPLPRQWSAKDKSSILGLSQNNLVVHYKGLLILSDLLVCLLNSLLGRGE